MIGAPVVADLVRRHKRGAKKGLLLPIKEVYMHRSK